MDRIEKLKNMLQDAPEDSFLKHALALEWIKRGDDAQAADLFHDILRKQKDYVGSYYHLGKLYERSGNLESAIATYRKGIGMATAAGDHHARNELQMALDDLDDL